MNAYEFKTIPELSAEEKKSPYARFYYEPVLPPAPEIVAAVQPGKQMNPSFAIAPKDIPKLFVPGSIKVDNGYCVLPDGTGFSIIHTKAPDTTMEMEKWWFTWFMSPDYNYLNYKIWLPSLHFTHGVPIYEDLGWGPVKIKGVAPVKSDMLNLPAPPKELNPDFLVFQGGAHTSIPDDGGAPYHATLVHYQTFGAKGLEIITCVWGGIHIIDGKPVRMIGKDEKVDPEYVRLFACHSAWEFARKGRLLPKLYAFSQTLK